MLLLLIEHDKTEVFERCEHRGARAYADIRLSVRYFPPCVPSFALREPGMYDCCPVAVAGAEEPDRLRRQRDLRYKHYDRFPGSYDLVHDRPDHAGFSASGNAVKQCRRGLPAPDKSHYFVFCPLLLLRKDGVDRIHRNLCLIRVAEGIFLCYADDIFRYKRFQRRHRNTVSVAQFGDGKASAESERRKRRLLLLSSDKRGKAVPVKSAVLRADPGSLDHDRPAFGKLRFSAQKSHDRHL